MGDKAVNSEDWEDIKPLPMDKKPMLDAPVSCKGPASASSQCVVIVSSLIYKHQHVWVGGHICNVVHESSSEDIIPFESSPRDTLPAKVDAVECAGKGGNGHQTATVHRECLMNFVQVYTVPLTHECSYEFDIERGKGPTATILVGMGVMCSVICMEVLEALVYEGFLDTQDNTNLIHSEVLLKKKDRDSSFQVT